MYPGAPKSVIGKQELLRIFQSFNNQGQKILPSNSRFKFALAAYASLGTVSIPLRTPNNFPSTTVTMDIVDDPVSVLLVLYLMGAEFLTPYTVSNRLIKRVSIMSALGQPRQFAENGGLG